MKKNFILICLSVFCSCFSYKSFVEVMPRTDIPNGVHQFMVETSIQEVKDSLKANAIGYRTTETGIETDHILLDEGTKAQYRVFSLDKQVKVEPYWGVTEKVSSQSRIWSGLSLNTEEMERVVYQNASTANRPKKVFDYGVQIFGKCGKVSW